MLRLGISLFVLYDAAALNYIGVGATGPVGRHWLSRTFASCDDSNKVLVLSRNGFLASA